MSGEKTQAIRRLNDAFRTTMRGGRVVMTAGVDALALDVKAMAIRRVATFTDFSPGNDPHGEHDFGKFELSGEKFFWKIDYYDPAMEFGSEDPTDPTKTTRVLTVMLTRSTDHGVARHSPSGAALPTHPCASERTPSRRKTASRRGTSSA
jgi:hypothetical protein